MTVPDDQNPPEPSSQLLERIVVALEQSTVAYQRNNELLEHLTGERSPKPNVMPLSEAWEVLGYGNYQQCYRTVQKGHYRLGYEVEDRRLSGSACPQYWLDIAACRARDKVIPSKRKG